MSDDDQGYAAMTNRFEVKYAVDYRQGIEFINDLRFFMKLDPAVVSNPYLVSSLYFDTADFQTYKEVISGHKKRYKLRLRRYSLDNDEGFFEIKHKYNRTIAKDRLKGRLHDFHKFIEQPIEKNLIKGMEKYWHFLTENRYSPTVTVNYQRIALLDLLGLGNRVTLDFDIRAGHQDLFYNGPTKDSLRVLPPGMAIIELKFHGKIAKWLQRLITKYKLSPTSYSKYVNSMDRVYYQKEIFTELY